MQTNEKYGFQQVIVEQNSKVIVLFKKTVKKTLGNIMVLPNITG